MDVSIWVVLSSFSLLCLTYTKGEVEEYCQSGFFKAACDPGHVIVVTEARYGRMRIGLCVRENFGYIGCTNNVQEVLDRLCSGRRQCSIRVLDDLFPGVSPCHADLKSFLEIEYSCERVITAPRHQCQAMKPVATAVSSGLVSSLIADETKCGSADAPWLIQVSPGQKVNITLLDFSTAEDNSSTSMADGMARVCRVYATIRETSISRSVTICGGEKRERAVYVSLQNTVEIRIISSKTAHKNVHFLLKYEQLETTKLIYGGDSSVRGDGGGRGCEVRADATYTIPEHKACENCWHSKAIGCPDVATPEEGYMKRNNHIAMFGCKNNEDSWQWVCQGTEWLGDIHRNCTPGLSIVIIMALAFVVGVLVLAIGLVFLRRQRPRPPRPDTYQDTALMLTDHTSNEIYVKHAITCNITTAAEANALMARNRPAGEGNDYASMKLLGQNPPTSSSDTNSFDDDQNRKPPPAGGSMQQQQQPQQQQQQHQHLQQQEPVLEWQDPDAALHYDLDKPRVEHMECCPELLHGHRQTVPAIRYIVPPHQCQHCGGQVHHKQHPQTPKQVQTLGRYKNEPTGGDGGGGGGGTPSKTRRHISFTNTLPSSKFTP